VLLPLVVVILMVVMVTMIFTHGAAVHRPTGIADPHRCVWAGQVSRNGNGPSQTKFSTQVCRTGEKLHDDPSWKGKVDSNSPVSPRPVPSASPCRSTHESRPKHHNTQMVRLVKDHPGCVRSARAGYVE
jgi:hypothetical protein